MKKSNLDDIDIINICQLISHSKIPLDEFRIKMWNKTTMARMSNNAENSYIHNIIPISRQTIYKKTI